MSLRMDFLLKVCKAVYTVSAYYSGGVSTHLVENVAMNLRTAIEPQMNDHGRRYETANSNRSFGPLSEDSKPKCIVVHSCLPVWQTAPSAVFLLLIQLQLRKPG